MMRDAATSITDVAAHLDALSPDDRFAALCTLGRRGQRALYDKAAGQPLGLEHFVPPDRGSLEPVRHRGCNTIPVPRPFQLFEKRFCRPAQGEGRLFGYNEYIIGGLIGPGYFVAVPTEGQPEWHERGPVVVDYFQVPDGPVVDGWPRVVPNSRGLQFFVYHKTRDFMRRVSSTVSIGAAYKTERKLDHYFVLDRV
jgi:hypothetical protein